MCHYLNYLSIKVKRLRLFPNNNKILLLLKVGTHDNTSLVPIVHQKKSHLIWKRQYVYD